jgi:hypothetical protein
MPDSPRLTREKDAERAARETRLAEALRDNLRRRKEQARARAADRDMPDSLADSPVDAPAGPRDKLRGNTRPTG